MLQFTNSTGFPGTLFASPDPQGIDSLYTVVKATFDLRNGVHAAEEQLPVVMASEHFGDPLTSSIRVPADISLVKPATDVLLLGSAHAPAGRPVHWMDVSLTVGPLRKYVRVFGDRHWEHTGMGYRMSAPAPFEQMPLVWERAFGGADEVDGRPTAEPRNPVGRGYRARDGARPLDGSPIPNLEDPYTPLQSWTDAPPPACFAPIAPHWKPRSDFAGTYDERWQRQRAPFLPEDFDPRFFQLAPPGLVASGYLRGGETVEIRGATPSGYLAFPLPNVGLSVTFVLGNGREERPACLDTVLIDADALRLVLVWRAALACDRKLLRVREVWADLAEAA